MAHAQLIQRLALRIGSPFHIRLQGNRCTQKVSATIAGFPLDTEHLRLILMVGETVQIIRRNLIRFRIIFTQQINLAYIIRYQRRIDLVILQGQESIQCFIVFFFHIIDVAQIEDGIRCMCLAHILQQTEPNLRFLHIPFLQISRCHLANRFIAFLVRQIIQVTTLVHFNRIT